MHEVLVRLPEALRPFAGNQAELRVDAGTAREVLQRIGEAHPQLLSRILTEEGELRPLVNVFVDRSNLRDLQGLATPVPPGVTLSIIPAVAGG
jgi:molybdopterin converting factor small subunit